MHRVFNILCAAAGLIVLSPLFAILALAIKWEGGGPVFYAQPRVGRGFRLFRVLKFRSMIVDADRFGFLTAPADSRLTRVGCFLRQYKLDELPQLWNVLKGEMQLVGARPEVERYVEMFPNQYAPLLEQPPGITDPATLAYRHEEKILIAGRRPEEREQQYVSKILPDKLRLSLEYQRRRNFLSDLGVLLHTFLGPTVHKQDSSMNNFG